jgi:hypothetical protein
VCDGGNLRRSMNVTTVVVVSKDPAGAIAATTTQASLAASPCSILWSGEASLWTDLAVPVPGSGQYTDVAHGAWLWVAATTDLRGIVLYFTLPKAKDVR